MQGDFTLAELSTDCSWAAFLVTLLLEYLYECIIRVTVLLEYLDSILFYFLFYYCFTVIRTEGLQQHAFLIKWLPFVLELTDYDYDYIGKTAYTQ